jgi:hypothetical protein
MLSKEEIKKINSPPRKKGGEKGGQKGGVTYEELLKEHHTLMSKIYSDIALLKEKEIEAKNKAVLEPEKNINENVTVQDFFKEYIIDKISDNYYDGIRFVREILEEIDG